MQSYISQQKDTDALIMEAADDRTLLSIIQSNRSLLKLGEEAFRKRMMRNYPILADQKSYFERWSNYYLRTVFFLSKLKEEFDVDYVPVPSFNPEAFYRGLSNSDDYKEDKNEYLANIYAELGNEQRIRNFIDSVGRGDEFIRDLIVASLLRYKNISLFEKLRNEWNIDYDFKLAYNAARSEDKNVINYLNKKGIIDNIPFLFTYATLGAAAAGSIDMLEYLSSLFPKKKLLLHVLLVEAAKNGQTEFIKYFLIQENSKILRKEIPAIIFDMYNENTIFLTEEKEKEVLNLLLDFYFSIGGTKKMFFNNAIKNVFWSSISDKNIKNFLKKKLE